MSSRPHVPHHIVEKDIEIAIGNGEGDLYIFKGKRKHPWKRSTGLGAISCLALGDLLGSGQNALVVLTTEGNCYLFNVAYQNSIDISTNKSTSDLLLDKKDDDKTLELGPPSRKYGSAERKLGPSHQSLGTSQSENDDKPTHTDSLQPQAGEYGSTGRSGSASWLTGRSESTSSSSQTTKHTEGAPSSATITATNTVVHDDWVSNAPSQSQPTSSLPRVASYSSLSAENIEEAVSSRKEPVKSSPDRIEPLYRWFIAGNGTCAIIADIDEDKQSELVIGSSNRVVYSYGIVHELDAMGAITTKLKLKNKWNVPGQVGSLSLSHDQWGRPILVVSQHGGNYTTIDHRGSTKYRQWGNVQPLTHSNAKDERSAPAIIRHASRSSVSPFGTPQNPVLMAMASLDGSIMLQEESSKEIWQKDLGHQLFALSVTDLTGDGNADIIACAWDGKTFIFDQQANCVEFQFEERVAAFVAGRYSVTKSTPQPCLVFVTFSDHVCIYYNLPIKSAPSHSLISRLGDQFEVCKNVKADKSGPWTRIEQARLIKSLLDPSKFDEAAAEEYKRSLEKKLQSLTTTST